MITIWLTPIDSLAGSCPLYGVVSNGLNMMRGLSIFVLVCMFEISAVCPLWNVGSRLYIYLYKLRTVLSTYGGLWTCIQLASNQDPCMQHWVALTTVRATLLKT